MEQIKNSRALEGKTIVKAHEDFEELWLSFSDGTFAVLAIERGYYDDVSLKLRTEPPRLLENTQAVLAIGLATVDQLKALDEERQNASRAEIERREKAELARLAAKYGK